MRQIAANNRHIIFAFICYILIVEMLRKIGKNKKKKRKKRQREREKKRCRREVCIFITVTNKKSATPDS
jgi:hypothetical protein